jgi:hypothetical protein
MLKFLRSIIVTLACSQRPSPCSASAADSIGSSDLGFPRVQIAFAAGLASTIFGSFFARRRNFDSAFLLATAATIAWQGRKIRPYTRFSRVQVRESTRVLGGRGAKRDPATFRLLISNVQMENQQHQRLLDIVRENAPDVVLAVETDAAWARGLEPLRADYPHILSHPQENYYGLVLFSRLPLINPQIRFLVQDDIPSVHTGSSCRAAIASFCTACIPGHPSRSGIRIPHRAMPNWSWWAKQSATRVSGRPSSPAI